jgi:hypothetical protein
VHGAALDTKDIDHILNSEHECALLRLPRAMAHMVIFTYKHNTTGKQELLSIVKTLKEFRDTLLGQQAIVHTDHLHILYGKLSNDRITRWRLLLEEYGPKYVHIAGKNNIVADALSRLEKEEDEKLSETE